MNIDLANRLAALRKEHNLSQEELAEKLGVSRQAISKWECGESSPDTDNLIALAEVYGITLDELVKGVPPQATETVRAEFVMSDEDEDDVDDDADVAPGEKRSRVSLLQKIVGSVGFLVAVIAYLIVGFLWKGNGGALGWASMWVLLLLPGIVTTLIAAIEARKPSHFQISLFVIAVYCAMGIIGNDYGVNLWHPYWAIFFLIPIYHGFAGSIEAYRRARKTKE